MEDMTIAVIGCGNMGQSLIGGLIAGGLSPARLRGGDPDAARCRTVNERYGIEAGSDNRATIATADIVILAVKPQAMQSTLQSLAPVLQQRAPMLISIAAGIPTSALARWAGGDPAIVRAMPNTPALLAAGATALYATPRVSSVQRRHAGMIMQAVGTVLWLEEEADLDLVTALSGSGPAYFFLLMEVLEQAAVELGFDPQHARRLTIQTALGAARMAAEGNTGPVGLRQQVTSPGGTTERALEVLQQGQLPALFRRALEAARDRSREIARDLGDT